MQSPPSHWIALETAALHLDETPKALLRRIARVARRMPTSVTWRRPGAMLTDSARPVPSRSAQRPRATQRAYQSTPPPPAVGWLSRPSSKPRADQAGPHVPEVDHAREGGAAGGPMVPLKSMALIHKIRTRSAPKQERHEEGGATPYGEIANRQSVEQKDESMWNDHRKYGMQGSNPKGHMKNRLVSVPSIQKLVQPSTTTMPRSSNGGLQ